MEREIKRLVSHPYEAVDRIKRNILQLYSDDFRKIDPTGRASALFESIPSELSRNTGRYKVGSVIDNGRASRMAVVLQDMADSMTVNFAYHADNPGAGSGCTPTWICSSYSCRTPGSSSHLHSWTKISPTI